MILSFLFAAWLFSCNAPTWVLLGLACGNQDLQGICKVLLDGFEKLPGRDHLCRWMLKVNVGVDVEDH